MKTIYESVNNFWFLTEKKKCIDGELCMKTILKKPRTDEYQRKVEAFVELCSESLFQCLTV
jgi:hypothetical protein